MFDVRATKMAGGELNAYCINSTHLKPVCGSSQLESLAPLAATHFFPLLCLIQCIYFFFFLIVVVL